MLVSQAGTIINISKWLEENLRKIEITTFGKMGIQCERMKKVHTFTVLTSQTFIKVYLATQTPLYCEEPARMSDLLCNLTSTFQRKNEY